MGEVWLQQSVRPRGIGPLVDYDPLEFEGEDVLCPGESENDTPEVRLVKKLRREDIAREYLKQHARTNITFRLRGPFNEGWHNPWSEPGKLITTEEARVILAQRGINYVEQVAGIRASSPIDLTSEAGDPDSEAARPPKQTASETVSNQKSADRPRITSNLHTVKRQTNDNGQTSPTPRNLPQTRRIVAKKDSIHHNGLIPLPKPSVGPRMSVFGSKASRVPNITYLPIYRNTVSSDHSTDENGRDPASRTSVSPELKPLSRRPALQRDKAAHLQDPATGAELRIEKELLQSRVSSIKGELKLVNKASKEARTLEIEKNVLQRRISAIQDEIDAKQPQVTTSNTTEKGKRARPDSLIPPVVPVGPDVKRAKTFENTGADTNDAQKSSMAPRLQQQLHLSSQDSPSDSKVQITYAQNEHTGQRPEQARSQTNSDLLPSSPTSSGATSKDTATPGGTSKAERKRLKRQRWKERKALEHQRWLATKVPPSVASNKPAARSEKLENNKASGSDSAASFQRKRKKRVSFSDGKDITSLGNHLPPKPFLPPNDRTLNREVTNDPLHPSLTDKLHNNTKRQRREPTPNSVISLGAGISQMDKNPSVDELGCDSKPKVSIFNNVIQASAISAAVPPNESTHRLHDAQTLKKEPAEGATISQQALLLPSGSQPGPAAPNVGLETKLRQESARASSENWCVLESSSGSRDSQNSDVMMSEALPFPTANRDLFEAARRPSIDSINTAWHKDHAKLFMDDSVPPKPEPTTRQFKQPRNVSHGRKPAVGKATDDPSYRVKVCAKEASTTDRTRNLRSNPACASRDQSSNIIKERRTPSHDKQSPDTLQGKATNARGQPSEGTAGKPNTRQQIFESHKGLAHKSIFRSPHVVPASTNNSEFPNSKNIPVDTIASRAKARLNENAANGCRLNGDCDHTKCGIEVQIPLRSSQASSVSPSISQANVIISSKSQKSSELSPTNSQPAPTCTTGIVEGGQRSQSTNSVFPEAQVVSNRAEHVPSGPSTDLLETDKQSLKFPSTAETDTQNKLSTPVEAAAARRAFRNRLMEMTRKDSSNTPSAHVAQFQGNMELASQAGNSPTTPAPASAALGTAPTGGLAEAEEPTNTQAMVDAMSPFAVSTVKKQGGFFSTIARPAAHLLGYLRGSQLQEQEVGQADPEVTVAVKRERNNEDDLHVEPAFDNPGLGMETSDDDDEEEYQLSQRRQFPKKRKSGRYDDAIEIDDESDFETTQRLLAARHEIRDEFGRWTKPDSLVKPTPSRMNLRSFSSSQSGQPQAGQESQGDTGLKAAIDDAGSFLGSWEVSQEARKARRNTMDDDKVSSQKAFQEAAAKISIGDVRGAKMARAKAGSS